MVLPKSVEAKLDRLMSSAAAGGQGQSDADIDAAVNAAMTGVSMENVARNRATRQRESRNDRGMVRGTVTHVTGEHVIVDMGGKSEGLLAKAEFDSPDEFKIGTVIEAYYVGNDKQGGATLLSRKPVLLEAAWNAVKIGDVVEGKVVGMNKGGLELKVGELRAFMPAGQCDVRRIPDISVFLNQKFPVQITRIDAGARELLVSRKAVVEKELVEQRRKVLAEIEEGQLRTGTVRSLVEFGAFVDLGGVDGLLHVADISWARIRSVGDVLKVGDTLEVKVLKIDKDKGKIALGLKQKKADPWIGITDRHPVGSRTKGRVVRVAPFGAFVELEEGVDGLVHVSEMSWIKRINNPAELVKEGQIVEVAILKVELDKREIRLGMKQVEANPWEEIPRKYPPHTILEGRKVVRVADFGAFVELEPGIEGLAHISELADARVRTVSEVAPVGKEVRAKVLSVDVVNRKIALTLRPSAMTPPPPPPSPEEIEARRKAAAEIAAQKAAEEAARNKRREKLRGGLGSPGKITLGGK